jgi:hypothetical protein
VPDPDVWFFGCYESGHFLYRRGGQLGASIEMELPEGCPWSIDDFDAGMLTGWDPYAKRSEVQGKAALGHLHGWAYLSFWDRSGDKRGNSNSGFLVNAELTFDDIVVLSKKAFPEIWDRFDFEVKLRDEQLPVVRGQAPGRFKPT